MCLTPAVSAASQMAKALIGGARQRLLAEEMFAGLRRRYRGLGVSIVRTRIDEQLDLGIVDHLSPVIGFRFPAIALLNVGGELAIGLGMQPETSGEPRLRLGVTRRAEGQRMHLADETRAEH